MRLPNSAYLCGALVGLCCFGAPQSAAAQVAEKPELTDYVSEQGAKQDSAKPQGWAANLTLGASFNLASNRSVVGQVDGFSLLFGANGLAGVSYVRDRHEWKNRASLVEAWSKTPALDSFIKSNDLLDFESIYSYFVAPWTGPFARLGLQTSLFKTERVTPTSQTYVREGDASNTPVANTERFRLADSLQPFTLNESVGWFVQPMDDPRFTLYGRAGMGGRHTFAEGARVIVDESNPSMVRFQRLSDVHQAGAELFAGFEGKSADGRLTYNAGAGVLFPILNNDKTDRSILELTRVAARAGLGVGIFDWMSLTYQLMVARDPQLIDRIQVQNALLLAISYSVSTPKPKPVQTPEERIAELESQLAAAQQRAAQAEAQTKPATQSPVQGPEPVAPPPTTEQSPEQPVL